MPRERKDSPEAIILKAFTLAEEEFGDHRSTEFLASIVADRLGISREEVFDGLIATAEETP